jgi:hypothetical protein
LTDEQKTALTDTVSAVHEEMMQRWLATDFDSVMPYFLNSPEVGWAWSGGVRYGYDDIAALFRPILDSFESANFAVGDRRVDVLARDAACVREYGAYSTTYTTGMTRLRDPFVMTTIWVRRSGEWKVLHIHEASTESGSSG